ncbi:MAG: DUF5667 domain-containing protein, partial [Candidatus Margulisiibacteriota bacterium]
MACLSRGAKSIIRCDKRWFDLFLISSFIIAAFLFPLSARAQVTDDAFTPPAENISVGVDGGFTPPAAEAAPEVLRDETVEIEDLGGTRATILPDNPLHFFKRVGWGLQEAFTFDPVADAELKQQHANQQLAEVKQLLEEKGLDGVSAGVLENSIQRFEDKIAAVADTADKLKEEKAVNPAAVDAFLDDVTDKQFEHQKFLGTLSQDLIEKKKAAQDGDIPEIDSRSVERVLGAVQQGSDGTLDKVTEVLVTVEDNPEDVSARLI